VTNEFEEAIDETLEAGIASISIADGGIEALSRALRRRIGATSSTNLQVKEHPEARRNTLSARYGSGPFPHHTDFAFCATPPRIIVLVNQTDNAFGRPTTVCNLANLGKREKAALSQSLWKLRTRARKFVVAGRTKLGRNFIHRWDLEVLSPSNGSAYFCKKILPNAFNGVETTRPWEPKSALLIDNWNCTHSRGRAGGEGDHQRQLLRIEVWHHAGMDQ
jgi:hypothetical protein